MHKDFNGNSPDKLRHTRSVAYSVELVVLNKHQISGGGAYLDCYHFNVEHIALLLSALNTWNVA